MYYSQVDGVVKLMVSLTKKSLISFKILPWWNVVSYYKKQKQRSGSFEGKNKNKRTFCYSVTFLEQLLLQHWQTDASELKKKHQPFKYISMSCKFTTQKMKISIKDFFSKCDQIGSFLRIWSHLLKKSLMESFIFCAVLFTLVRSDF